MYLPFFCLRASRSRAAIIEVEFCDSISTIMYTFLLFCSRSAALFAFPSLRARVFTVWWICTNK